MTDHRFNELLRGPLHHPILPLLITRLSLALRVVVEVTGEAGARALEAHCRELNRHDCRDSWQDYPEAWPECAAQCGRPALDGHLTCGRAECGPEAKWRAQ